jgi:alanine-synthesizing transaminase
MPQKVVRPAKRTDYITYAVRDIVVLANQVAATGKEMLYLNIGDPNLYDFAPPAHVVEAVHKAMLKNQNGYAPSSGIPEAIKAIEEEAKCKGIKNIQDIFITTGASEAIEVCLTALVDSGENVLAPAPGYPLYTAVSSKLQAIEVPYYLDEANNWQPDIEDMRRKINERTRGIILINPNNPTGSLYSKEVLLKIIDIALEFDLIIFTDEIYDKLLLDNEEYTSIASLNSDVSCITFGGLSKNYFVPGFRIGWGIISGKSAILGEFIEAVNKILRARLSANHPEQYAIKPALEGIQDHLIVAKEKLTRRRDITYQMLNSFPGISCEKPEGAFYAFPRLHMEYSDEEFVNGLIKETGVVVVPGTGFVQYPFTHHFRVAFLPQEDKLEKAYKSIGEYFNKFMNEHK